MKRTEMIQFIKDTLDKVPAKKDGTHSDFDCDFLLTELEKVGIKPPEVKVSTPYGSRIFFEISEWEENINIDEAGYDLSDDERPERLPKAKIIKSIK